MPRPRTSVKAIIVHDGKVLAIEKRDAAGPYYIFPGGGQHHGESLLETLRRECLEETSLEVHAGRLRYVRDYIAEHHEFADVDSGVHQVEFYFECTAEDPEAAAPGHEPDENQVAIAWLPLDGLAEQPLYPRALLRILSAADDSAPVYLGDVN